MPDQKKLRENVTGILHAYEVQQEALTLQIAAKSSISQRSSAPAILESSLTCQNRLLEPAVLGGSPSTANQLSIKGNKPQKRSPKSPRKTKLMPFKRFEKRTNGVVPAENAPVITNGIVSKERKTLSNDELSSDCLTNSFPPQRIIAAMHRKMVGFCVIRFLDYLITFVVYLMLQAT